MIYFYSISYPHRYKPSKFGHSEIDQKKILEFSIFFLHFVLFYVTIGETIVIVIVFLEVKE